MVELVFMMLILKLPILYLVAVVWWAVRSEPKPLEPALVAIDGEPGPRRPSARRRSPRPRGGPHERLSRRPRQPPARTSRARPQRGS